MLKLVVFIFATAAISHLACAEVPDVTTTEKSADQTLIENNGSDTNPAKRETLQETDAVERELLEKGSKYIQDLKRAVRSKGGWNRQVLRSHRRKNYSSSSDSSDNSGSDSSSSSSSQSDSSDHECKACRVINMNSLHKKLKQIADIVKGETVTTTKSSEKKKSCEICKCKCNCKSCSGKKSEFKYVPIYELEKPGHIQQGYDLQRSAAKHQMNYYPTEISYNTPPSPSSYQRNTFQVESAPLGYIKPAGPIYEATQY